MSDSVGKLCDLRINGGKKVLSFHSGITTPSQLACLWPEGGARLGEHPFSSLPNG
jgi:hypothetical protein